MGFSSFFLNAVRGRAKTDSNGQAESFRGLRVIIAEMRFRVLFSSLLHFTNVVVPVLVDCVITNRVWTLCTTFWLGRRTCQLQLQSSVASLRHHL